jgi:hypothetical protein
VLVDTVCKDLLSGPGRTQDEDVQSELRDERRLRPAFFEGGWARLANIGGGGYRRLVDLERA